MVLKLFVLTLAVLFNPISSQSSSDSERLIQPCASIQAPYIPGAKLVSIERNERHNITVPATPPFSAKNVTSLNFCEVKLTLTHEGADDKVLVQIWLPLNNWNGRFVGVGGSGWAAGLLDLDLAPVVLDGFAAASTNAGLSGDVVNPGLWALKKNGEINWPLLTNFASRSVHDLAVVGKSVTANYYGTGAKHSYFKGCSTGGRQGLVAAQQYHKDFDGILSSSPAINLPDYVVAEQWPQVAMKQEGYFPSQCEFNGVIQAAIAACDELDGVKDQVISDLSRCIFDPFTVVGSKIQCDGKKVIITKPVASVVQKIWDGPKTTSGTPLWYGLTVGAPFEDIANTVSVNGTQTGSSFFITDTWIRYFLKSDPKFDVSTVDSLELTRLFSASARKYRNLLGSADPDLSSFRNAGGKLLVWHGEADPLIFPQGTRKYRDNVEKAMGGSTDVDQFFCLFLAPGVDHCGQGTTPGAVPSDPFSSLISWVEKGIVPEVLSAATSPSAKLQFTRKLCYYPWVSKYRGSGDPNSSDSHTCVQSY